MHANWSAMQPGMVLMPRSCGKDEMLPCGPMVAPAPSMSALAL